MKWSIGISALLCLNLAFASAIELPELGSSSATLLDLEKEKTLAEGFMITIRQEVPFLDEPLVEEYIQKLGQTLVAGIERESWPFHFFVVNNTAINAFAGPGRHIGVHSGLILATENENELAAVMAHEIAHVTQHHIARQFERAKAMTLPTLAGFIAAAALAGKSSMASTAILATTAAGSAQLTVNQMRDNEQEADRIGMQILANHHYDPRAMPLFFKRLQMAMRYNNRGDIPDIVSTHPVTETRIADALNRAGRYPKGKENIGLMDYLWIRTFIQVHSTPDIRKTLMHFKTLHNAYGEALCYIQLGEREAALHLSERLYQKEPKNLYYAALYAESLQESRQLPKSIEILEKAIQKHPRSYALQVMLAEYLLLAKQPERTLMLLEPLTTEYTYYPTPFRLMAQSRGERGQLAAAFEARAQHYYLIGQLTESIQQMELALKQPHDEFSHKKFLERLEFLKHLESEMSFKEPL